MAKTSINFQPLQPSSEVHNERDKYLDYIRSDLTPHNQVWRATGRPLMAIEKYLKEDYLRSHTKKIPKTAVLIREGVAVLEQGKTMEQIKRACAKLKQRFGITTLEIYIHEDEGHWQDNAWVPNRHAHIVASWYDMTHHTTLKLKRSHFSEIQTIFAEELGMERGVSSDRTHLNSLQYKAQQLEMQIAQQEAQIKAMKEEVTELEEKKRRAKIETDSRQQTMRYYDVVNQIDRILREGKPRKLLDRLEDFRDIVLTSAAAFKEDLYQQNKTIQRLKQEIEYINQKNEYNARLNPILANMDNLLREMKDAGLNYEQIRHIFTFHKLTTTINFKGIAIPNTTVELLPEKKSGSMMVWFNRKTWADYTKDYKTWGHNLGRRMIK